MSKQDIDLQKMQVLESSYQGLFNFRSSLIAGTIVGILILLATLQFESILPPYGIVVGYLVVLAFGYYALHEVRQTQNEHIAFMDGLITRIEKDERLGSIENLRQELKESTTKKKEGRYLNQSQKIIVLSVIIVIVLFLVWVFFYYAGLPFYNPINSSQNYGSIIQGMSALLGIVLAAAIFRIQSLENRLQSLEQSTLDYVFKIIGHSYPEWDKRFESNIRNGKIIEVYLKSRLSRPQSIPNLVSGKYEKDAKDQQMGLEHILNKHNNLKQTITMIKNQVMGVSIIFIIPIAFSFLLLMTTDKFTTEANFFMVSLMIYLSIAGIGLLIAVVLLSMIQQMDN